MWRHTMFAQRSADGDFINRQLKGAQWWAELMSGDNLSAAMYPLIFHLDSPHLKTWFNLKIKPFPVENTPELLARRFPDAVKGAAQPTPTMQPSAANQPARSAPAPAATVSPPPAQTPIPSGEFGAVMEEIESGGLILVAVSDEGVAAAAGLEAGDILTRLNEQPLKSLEQFKQLFAEAKKGDILTLEFSRGGKISTVKIQR
jgi:membrane-associated protease RseP (regulator of RpoE activity)